MPAASRLYDEYGMRQNWYGAVTKFAIAKKNGSHSFLGGGLWENHESAANKARFAEWDDRWGVAIVTERCLMNVSEELKTEFESVAQLWSAYEKRLQEFRSAVKNDISSLEASARKATDAVAKMNKAYGDVVAQLNGVEMTQAITNAERLAEAMKALANLQSHKLTFAVIDAQANKS